MATNRPEMMRFTSSPNRWEGFDKNGRIVCTHSGFSQGNPRKNASLWIGRPVRMLLGDVTGRRGTDW
jgi:hypothetical protein